MERPEKSLPEVPGVILRMVGCSPLPEPIPGLVEIDGDVVYVLAPTGCVVDFDWIQGTIQLRGEPGDPGGDGELPGKGSLDLALTDAGE